MCLVSALPLHTHSKIVTVWFQRDFQQNTSPTPAFRLTSNLLAVRNRGLSTHLHEAPGQGGVLCRSTGMGAGEIQGQTRSFNCSGGLASVECPLRWGLYHIMAYAKWPSSTSLLCRAPGSWLREAVSQFRVSYPVHIHT